MQNISQLIGKEAITLMDASSKGTVLNVYFNADLSKCKYFSLMLDDSEEIEWVSFKDLCSVKNDAVVIRSKACIKKDFVGEIYKSPINLSAFNQDGVLLGTVKDIQIDGDKTQNIITDLKSISIAQLLSFSKELLVFNDSDQPIKKKRITNKTASIGKKADNKKTKANQPIDGIDANPLDFGFYKNAIRIVSDKNQSDNQEKSDTAPKNTIRIKPIAGKDMTTDANKKIETPLKIPPEKTDVYRSPMEENILSRYGFLIGKRIQRPILDQNGLVLAKENDLVTEEIIRKIKENGKLIMLALHSL